MQKSIMIIIITSILSITGNVFADNSPTDCAIVIWPNLEQKVEAYKSIEKYTNVLPAAGFKQALTNLKAYCCSQAAIQCTENEKNNLKNLKYPESAFLFDHLLDVMMRRLDGIPKLAYGLEVDPTGAKWREYITKVANDAVGVQSSEIEKTYKEYRTLHTDFTTNLNTVMGGYKKNEIASLSLADKYDTLCKIIKEIYNNTQYEKPVIINSYLSACEKTVLNRVNRENGYTKILMVQKSNLLFDETTKAYTKKYFVEEKLMALWTLVAKVKDIFQTIVQQAAASKSCSK